MDLYAVIFNADDQERTVDAAFDPGSGSGGRIEQQSITVEPNSTRVVKCTILIPGAKEWSYAAPHLYTAYVRLYQGAELVDSLSVVYGMRQFRVDGTQVLLNNQKVFLKGTNWHEETQKRAFHDQGRV